MKIAILGTRGIPNNYGGFEQFAEFLSEYLVKKGHTVYVYNSHNHPYQEKTWNGVNLVHKYDPENKIGTPGQFIYDLNCILDSRKRDLDVILNLGYTSSSIWSRFFPKKSILITNMDGLEWKRTKFSKKVQKFLMYAEKLAVKHSDLLVADSKAIQSYIAEKYQKSSHFIAYGATLFKTPNEEILKTYDLEKFSYNMLIARMEPENNIETILDGVHASFSKQKFLVIGNPTNKFGMYLTEKFKKDDRIVFLGTIYDINILNNLRYFCNFYFHGHSVGGTNPSLLEAMSCSCLIVAHNNGFNKSVLEENSLYFDTYKDISVILNTGNAGIPKTDFVVENSRKIEFVYNWGNINQQYESMMLKAISSRNNE